MAWKETIVRTLILSASPECAPVRIAPLPPATSIRTLIDASGNATPINPQDAQFIGLPANPDPTKVGPIGNLGRNTERAPGLKNWDLNVVKRFRITEGLTLQFRGEFFNLFNTPQYGTVSVSPFSPSQTAPVDSGERKFLSTGSFCERLFGRWRRPCDSLAVAPGILGRRYRLLTHGDCPLK